jgi:bacterioferritin (cytochrome b1)
MQYILNNPWPAIEAQQKNPAAVRQLANLMCGPQSELTDILQYFYNSLILKAQGNEALSELFSCVSVTEMHHLEKLGELIGAYGGDPRLIWYRNGQPNWWYSGFVQARKNEEQMLSAAVSGERMAAQNYRAVASRLAPNAAAVLNRIAMDEQHHAELFTAAMTPKEPRGTGGSAI